MVDSNTTVFNINVIRQKLLRITLNEVVATMIKNGYNPVNQLVGYITTGDLCYITSKEDARNKISRFNKEEILLAIVNGYLEK